MNWTFFELMRLAVWLSPDDPASAFMWLVVGIVVPGEALLLVAIIRLQLALERRRDRIRLATDWNVDPDMLGDYVEVRHLELRR